MEQLSEISQNDLKSQPSWLADLTKSAQRQGFSRERILVIQQLLQSIFETNKPITLKQINNLLAEEEEKLLSLGTIDKKRLEKIEYLRFLASHFKKN